MPFSTCHPPVETTWKVVCKEVVSVKKLCVTRATLQCVETAAFSQLSLGNHSSIQDWWAMNEHENSDHSFYDNHWAKTNMQKRILMDLIVKKDNAICHKNSCHRCLSHKPRSRMRKNCIQHSLSGNLCTNRNRNRNKTKSVGLISFFSQGCCWPIHCQKPIQFIGCCTQQARTVSNKKTIQHHFIGVFFPINTTICSAKKLLKTVFGPQHWKLFATMSSQHDIVLPL